MCEALTEETAKSLAKGWLYRTYNLSLLFLYLAVCCIRAIVGLKHFQESIVMYWREALQNSNNNSDPIHLQRRRRPIPPIELPFISGSAAQIVKEATKNLGISITIYGKQPTDAVDFDSECIQWNMPFIETFDQPKIDEVEIYPKEGHLNVDTIMAYLSEFPDADFVIAELTKILNSAKSNDDIQYEVSRSFGVIKQSCVLRRIFSYLIQ